MSDYVDHTVKLDPTYSGVWVKTAAGKLIPSRADSLDLSRVVQMWEDPTDPTSRLLSVSETLDRPLIGPPIYFDRTVSGLKARLMTAIIGDRIVPADLVPGEPAAVWDGNQYEADFDHEQMSHAVWMSVAQSHILIPVTLSEVHS